MGIACKTPSPSILLACHESRALALETLELAFSCPLTTPETYFDFKRDTLCIDARDSPCYMSGNLAWDGIGEEELWKVERLAIVLHTAYDYDEETITSMLGRFGCVKKLYLALRFDQMEPNEEAQADFCMIDPLDVNATFKIYQSFDVQAHFAAGDLDGAPAPTPANMTQLGTPMADLEDLWEYEDCVPFPEIEIKTMIPYETKVALQEAEDNCKARIETFMRQMEMEATSKSRIEDWKYAE